MNLDCQNYVTKTLQKAKSAQRLALATMHTHSTQVLIDELATQMENIHEGITSIAAKLDVEAGEGAPSVASKSSSDSSEFIMSSESSSVVRHQYSFTVEKALCTNVIFFIILEGLF